MIKIMDPKEKKNLVFFGYGLAVIITFFAIRSGVKHGFTNGEFIALGCAVVLALLTAVSLKAIRPVYKIWMKVALLIGEVMNFLILSVIFYVLFSFAGIVLRLIRKDLLDEKINKSAKTYWKPSRSVVFDRESYTKQY